MSEKHQFLSDSDEDDEDYIPERQDSLSELDSEVDTEIVTDTNDYKNSESADVNKVRKRKKIMNKDNKRKKGQRKVSLREETEEERLVEDTGKTKLLSEEEEKKRADSLWADFMKDAAVVSKPKSGNSATYNISEKSDSSYSKPKIEDKVKITHFFEFAGEKIGVEKEVLANSTSAKLSIAKDENIVRNINIPLATEKRGSKDRRTRKIGFGGISSVLNQLEKKTKITTLEKSKLDWDNFKKQENIEEEINTHNKGKDGYLEKQDFLQRADYRQFEIEKQLRSVSRRNNS